MASPDPSFSDDIGRYRLIREIARGGMAIVYVAAARGPAGFNKLVALKELRPELVQDSDFLTMFLDEARLAARLRHPNIVQTIDVSQAEGRHFIAMEYLEGCSLHSALKRFAAKGGFPQRMAISVLRDVLCALDYAHKLTDRAGSPLHCVHRDVSPSNVFVTYEGHTKVIDFGIAKACDSSVETKTGVFKGRVSYMSPEQLTGRADRRTDLFAVGAILFEILSGRRLWHGLSELEIVARLSHGNIPSLDGLPRGTPSVLAEVCRTALAEHPEDRMSTAADMHAALNEYVRSTGGPLEASDIGTAIATEFASDRLQMRAQLDSALARLQARGTSKALVPVPPPDESGWLERLTPLEPQDPLGIVSVPAHPRMVKGTPPTAPPALPPDRAPTTPAARTLWPFWRHAKIGGAALGAAAVVVTLGVEWRRATTTPAQPAVLAAPAAPPAPARAPVETILLSVTVAPTSATLVIDGEAIPSNRFVGRFPKDMEIHRILARAPGHDPKERLVSFANNVMIDLNLTPVLIVRAPPPPARRSPPRRVETPPRATPLLAPVTPPQARASAPADIAPRGAWEPARKRSIDSKNPYGEDQ